ncbi:VWA domain-containing protein [Pedobacter duraquae]|uniref:phospholipase D n=1 Tax=Pedobacter duraquae TaxID=425511 RepID=A0A4R6IEL3_9SPHI|nr:VWA domain-containing protein [Pedobacter duraquae]TDO19355.1 phospholipase D-like protein [Pedobacter duraquae]
MDKTARNVGVITQLAERKHKDGNPYKIAFIECSSFDFKIGFHQKSLINRSDISNLSDGKLITFALSEIKTVRGDRMIANECLISCNKEIEENILNYDQETINLIFQKTSLEFSLRMKAKLANGTIPNTPISLKLKEADKQPSLIDIEKKGEYGFLRRIFDINSPEYNIKLIATLSEGIKQIDEDHIYDQAKLLLKINSDMGDKMLSDLNLAFYNKATDLFQLLLWLDGYVDFCPTPFLGKYFENASLEMKAKIKSRLGFDTIPPVTCPTDTEHSDIEVFFSGIRAKLLEEISKATQNIRVAIAWFTNHELFDLLCYKLKQNVKVELIIINDYINNWELGLPFQSFIDLGGALYFSDYPGLMHHKFCLIDDKVLVNGSYNWTYYAESFNKENLMIFRKNPTLINIFKREFETLKSDLGNPITGLIHFQENQITRFERKAYTEYVSTDLALKASQIKPQNAEFAAIIVSKAVMFNPENYLAVSLGDELEGLVGLEKNSQIVLNTLNPVIIPDAEKISNIATATKREDSHERSGAVQTIPVKKDCNVDCDFLTHQITPVYLNPDDVEVLSRPLSANLVFPQVQDVTTVDVRPSGLEQENKKFNQKVSTLPKSYSISRDDSYITNPNLQLPIQSFSIPIKKTKAEEFENLRVGIALDTSGSMEELYKNGTVQRVLERLLSLAIAVSHEGSLNIWTFADISRKHEEVDKNNYKDYITKNKITAGGLTHTFKVVDAISENYLTADNFTNPVFVIILTDGDVGNIEIQMADTERYPVFWQFVVLGSDTASLKKLNIKLKNISFFQLDDIETISENVLYGKLLNTFPNWYKNYFRS